MSATRHRERARRATFALAIVAIVVLAMSTVSCGADKPADSRGKVVEIVVPLGTQDKLDRGELVDVMPAELYFRVGDVLRISNNDTSDQYVGPYLVRAGEHFELKYGSPGRYGGLCNLSGGSTYKIVITE